MAPKRRGRPSKADKPAADEVSERKETSAAKEQALANADAEEGAEEQLDETEPSPKKPKVEEKKKRGRKPKATMKKVSKTKPDVEEGQKESVEDGSNDDEDLDDAPASAKSKKVVVIEASKECNCFKVGANKVQAGLTEAISGIEVRINPEKPRKGCFEVRDEGGNIYLSLLGLLRPFTKLKNLDMDMAVKDIVSKLK